MRFFGLCALLMAGLSLAFFLPVMNDYMNTGLVARFPTLIVCGFVMLGAMNLLFAGIILQTIKHKERREFEFRLQEIYQWQKERLS